MTLIKVNTFERSPEYVDMKTFRIKYWNIVFLFDIEAKSPKYRKEWISEFGEVPVDIKRSYYEEIEIDNNEEMSYQDIENFLQDLCCEYFTTFNYRVVDENDIEYNELHTNWLIEMNKYFV